MFVRPSTTNPAARSLVTTLASTPASMPASVREPPVYGSPAIVQPRSFTSAGTPRNGVPSGAFAASSSALSKRLWTTQLSSPSRASIRAMAAPTSSRGETSPSLTARAWPTASRSSISSMSTAPLQPGVGDFFGSAIE
ncbi:hypothetical protein GCM10009560_11260 [Nonomuraea longicatena]|uniref:Uncharacterized protein n=1 Tax=Nonomuraea longicatena TaxID=83682 RepID=A0ABP3Z9A0_9ACTN